jgi:protein-L-isoaspartate(D-aspartate) O-methyltransferase
MMDFARARRTMVDTQIRVNDVTDTRIVDALMAVPAGEFRSRDAAAAGLSRR